MCHEGFAGFVMRVCWVCHEVYLDCHGGLVGFVMRGFVGFVKRVLWVCHEGFVWFDMRILLVLS